MTATIGPRVLLMRYGGEKLEQNKGRGHRILTTNDSLLTFRSPNYLYSNGAFGVSCNGFYVESTQIGELSRLNVWVEFIQSELKHFCIRIVIRLQQGRFYVGQGALAPPPLTPQITCSPPPRSKASWPFWRDFWGARMLQNPNFPGLRPGSRCRSL